MNIYGIEQPLCGYAPSEWPEVECPYCGGVNTLFISDDHIHDIETYLCYDCEASFEVEHEIPY